MNTNFNQSQTKINLMRAFAGESQARNRYTFGASQAKTAKFHVIEAVFLFTADQEKAHAKVFLNHLKECAGENIQIEAGYPVDISDSILELLRYAQHNEFEEYQQAYADFAKTATAEGYPKIANSFTLIGKIEEEHGKRFEELANLMANNQLFVSEVQCKWMCLNCGHIHEGKSAPEQCPACDHNQGFFIRLALAPFSK